LKTENVIFQNRYLKITDRNLCLFWYYFPIGQSKTIEFSEIEDIRLEELKLFYGKYRIWGMDLNIGILSII